MRLIVVDVPKKLEIFMSHLLPMIVSNKIQVILELFLSSNLDLLAVLFHKTNFIATNVLFQLRYILLLGNRIMSPPDAIVLVYIVAVLLYCFSFGMGETVT